MSQQTRRTVAESTTTILTKNREYVKTPEHVMDYLREARVFDKAVKARWDTVAFRKVANPFAKAVHKEFMRQYRESIKFLNKKKAFERLHKYAQRKHPEVYEKTKAEDIKEINRYFRGWDKSVKPERMADVIAHYLPLAGAIGGDRALKELGFSIAFHLKNPAVIKALEKRGVKITGKITKTTLNNFRSTFYKAYMEEGMSPYELKKRIKGMFAETYKNRAMFIARTETGIAQMTVQHETYKRNGVKLKRWLAIIDDRTRESHVMANGQTVNMNEPFDVGGVDMMHPLDGNAPAAEVIQCRCDFTSWEVDKESLPENPWAGEK